MNFGLLILRLVVGLLFAGHGAQKLFGWFGGHGLGGTEGLFETLGLKPARLHAKAAGLAEFVGGLLLVVGLFTPVAAAALIAVMVAAVMTVHLPKGLWAAGGGYEYNLVLATAAFALAGTGAGNLSLDHAFKFNDFGVPWAIAALVIGALGGVGAVLSGRGESAGERSGDSPDASTA